MTAPVLPNRDTILVGIGCEPEQELPAEVLSFSIRHSTEDVRIIKLYTAERWADESAALKTRQRTPFSLQRFLLCDELLRSDAAIGVYMDSDMLVVRGLEELTAAFAATGAEIATAQVRPEWRRKRQSSVMVFDRNGAERLWASYQAFVRGELSYDQLLYLQTVGPIGDLPYSWNCLEYVDETTGLLHYTDMDRQPWLRSGNPNAGVWYAYLWRMLQTSAGEALLFDAIARGEVRPGLRAIAELGPSVSSESVSARIRDMGFIPPHRFVRIKSPLLRKLAAPFLRGVMNLQFLAANGQLNVR